MQHIPYSQARPLIGDADLLLFSGKALWPSIPLRWWDNGYRWNDPTWRAWLTLGPWSHAEIARWDRSERIHTLEGWGSVSGGPRKIPLSQLLYRYGSFGWCRYRFGHGMRAAVMRRASELWRPGEVDYPSWRQYVRTALRQLYKEKADVSPMWFSCWEWTAACHSLPSPATQYPSDLIACGLFEPLVMVGP